MGDWIWKSRIPNPSYKFVKNFIKIIYLTKILKNYLLKRIIKNDYQLLTLPKQPKVKIFKRLQLLSSIHLRNEFRLLVLEFERGFMKTDPKSIGKRVGWIIGAFLGLLFLVKHEVFQVLTLIVVACAFGLFGKGLALGHGHERQVKVLILFFLVEEGRRRVIEYHTRCLFSPDLAFSLRLALPHREIPLPLPSLPQMLWKLTPSHPIGILRISSKLIIHGGIERITFSELHIRHVMHVRGLLLCLGIPLFMIREPWEIVLELGLEGAVFIDLDVGVVLWMEQVLAGLEVVAGVR